MTSREHELAVQEKVHELEAEGWRTFKLDRKSPDAIAIKDGNVIAIEILGRNGNLKVQARKRDDYKMFDDVIFGFHNGQKLSDIAKQLRVPLATSEAEQFEKIKMNLGIQSDTDTVRFILKRWEQQ